MWQRFDISAASHSSIQDLINPNSSILAELNGEIAEQLKRITEAHQADSLAWLYGLDQTIDDLTNTELACVENKNTKALQAELRKRINNKKRRKNENNSSAESDLKPGDISPISFQVKVEVQKRNLGEQARVRLFLRNQSQQIKGFGDPRDTGLFGACLEVKLPQELWKPIELSRFQISYQVDSEVSAQGINCTPGYEKNQDKIRIWTEFLPIHWQKRLYTASLL